MKIDYARLAALLIETWKSPSAFAEIVTCDCCESRGLSADEEEAAEADGVEERVFDVAILVDTKLAEYADDDPNGFRLTAVGHERIEEACGNANGFGGNFWNALRTNPTVRVEQDARAAVYKAAEEKRIAERKAASAKDTASMSDLAGTP